MKNTCCILLLLWPLVFTGQPACERMYETAKLLAAGGQYQAALNKLAAAKICNSKEPRYDSLIILIYNDINKQKQLAVVARDQAERALIREKKAKKDAEIARTEAENERTVVQKQLVTSYWKSGQIARSRNNFIDDLLFTAAAMELNKDPDIHKKMLIDIEQSVPQVGLKQILVHGKPLNSAAFSPDGKLVLTACQDMYAYFWTVATGKLNGTPLQHYGAVKAVAFSPDGKWALTGSDDKNGRLWDVASRVKLIPGLVHQKYVIAVAFSPSGKQLLTAGWDGTARLWDAATGNASSPPMAHGGIVATAVFSADGQRILTASNVKTVVEWDAVTGKQNREIIRQNTAINTAVISPDQKTILTTAGDRSSRFYNAVTGKETGVAINHPNWLFSALFSPDGEQILTASWDRNARLWNAHNGAPLAPVLKHANTVTNAVFSNDGMQIVTTSDDKTARIWTVSPYQSIPLMLTHRGAVKKAIFSPDGKKIITTTYNRNGGVARIWDAVTGRQLGQEIRHKSDIMCVVFNPNGDKIATSGYDSVARVWSATDGKPLTPWMKHRQFIYSVVFSANGQYLLTASADSTAQVWDAVSGMSTGVVIKHQSYVYSANFSADGNFFTIAGATGTSGIWQTSTGKRVGLPVNHNGAILDAVFSADGKKLMTASADNSVRLWDAKTGEYAGVTLPLEGRAIHAVFSADGKLILTQNSQTQMGNGVARLWNAQTGRPVGSVMRHGFSVDENMHDARFSPDSKLVITASKDSTARLWDATNGLQLGNSLKHLAAVNSAVFSPDGKRILTASDDGTARIWELAGDFDLPPALFASQAKVLTGCEMNAATNEVEVISPAAWDSLKTTYTQLAGAHYLRCAYPRHNTWSHFNPEAAAIIRPAAPAPNIADAPMNVASFYRLNGQTDKAEKMYTHLLTTGAASEPLQAAAASQLGALYTDQGRFAEAGKLLLQAFSLYKKLSQLKPDEYGFSCIETAGYLVNLHNAMVDSLKFAAFTAPMPTSFAPVQKELDSLAQTNGDLRYQLASYYGNCSWYMLFASRFAEAEQAGRKGLLLDPKQDFIKGNLAHSLLLQGKWQEAQEIYTALKPIKRSDGISYATISLEDLDDLEKHGITHKDMEKARTMLKE